MFVCRPECFVIRGCTFSDCFMVRTCPSVKLHHLCEKSKTWKRASLVLVSGVVDVNLPVLDLGITLTGSPFPLSQRSALSVCFFGFQDKKCITKCLFAPFPFEPARRAGRFIKHLRESLFGRMYSFKCTILVRALERRD